MPEKSRFLKFDEKAIYTEYVGRMVIAFEDPQLTSFSCVSPLNLNP